MTQGDGAHLLFVSAVGGELASAAVVDDGAGAAPALRDIETVVDFRLELTDPQVADHDEWSFGSADFEHGFVSSIICCFSVLYYWLWL